MNYLKLVTVQACHSRESGNPYLLRGICFVLLLFGFANLGYALGFGPSTLNSYLNEPLNLDVELVDAETTNLDNLSASLASVDDFKRADMQRPYFLSQLRFEVRREGRRSYIHVTSPDAIKQPFVDFLIDLSWPGGHSVRGYTILLDPPPISNARKNVVLPSQDQNSNNSEIPKNEEKSIDKQPMETLFGPEDKTQIPLSAKVETVAKQTPIEASQEPSLSKKSAENITDDNVENDHSKGALSLGGKIVGAISFEKQNEQVISVLPNILKETLAQLQNKQQIFKHPILLQGKVNNKSLPNWLFWTSSIALLCIVSLTIWAVNKYRLGKPRSKSESEYFEVSGEEKISLKNVADIKNKNAKVSSHIVINPDPDLKQELSIKLVLAAQYLEVNDQIAAKKLLEEILAKGDDQQKADAQNLLLKMEGHD